MEYKGYVGEIERDEEGRYRGHVINIKDVITFWGHTEEEAAKEFEISVDDYLDLIRLEQSHDHD